MKHVCKWNRPDASIEDTENGTICGAPYVAGEVVSAQRSMLRGNDICQDCVEKGAVIYKKSAPHFAAALYDCWARSIRDLNDIKDEMKEVTVPWAGIKLEIMNYIRRNIRGGTRWTNIESMFQALGVGFDDQLYSDREKIVSELINDGELKTFTEPWRDYCWLIPKEVDHIKRFPGTCATVECEPFGYGYVEKAT